MALNSITPQIYSVKQNFIFLFQRRDDEEEEGDEGEEKEGEGGEHRPARRRPFYRGYRGGGYNRGYGYGPPRRGGPRYDMGVDGYRRRPFYRRYYGPPGYYGGGPQGEYNDSYGGSRPYRGRGGGGGRGRGRGRGRRNFRRRVRNDTGLC